ncbi:MAG TPA: hypothetical protein VJW76_14450 [Verrucomicrobiae bacterium]|nr:hypothetical protein [Verrucomicrobiae bacterium]
MKVSDIPTETFNQIIEELRSQGWRKVDEYDNMDAWIDYGMVVLEKSGASLRFEWDNWMEGSVDGPDVVVQEIRRRYKLK